MEHESKHFLLLNTGFKRLTRQFWLLSWRGEVASSGNADTFLLLKI